MPEVGGQKFSYSSKGRSAADRRRKLLKQRFGKNWRAKFYGKSIPGYQHGVVKKVQKLRERLATGPGTDKQRAKFDRLVNVAGDVVEKRQKFDTRHDIKRPPKPTGSSELGVGGQRQGFNRVFSSDRPVSEMQVNRGYANRLRQAPPTTRTRPKHKKVRRGFSSPFAR